MRVALIHDYLNQYGGGERVLETFSEIFPDAPVYTLFYDPETTFQRFELKVRGTSFLDKDIVRKNHRPFIPLMPFATRFLKLQEEYDVILSSSAGFAKGIRYPKKVKHVSYCHTPLRYAWEHHNYFTDWSPALKLISAPAFSYLRWWDRRAAQRPDVLLANSHFIAEKVKRYYHRDAEVVYPPVDIKTFFWDKKISKDGYFLAIGRLIHYKRFDLVIQAFNKLNLPLVVVGIGSELERLKKMVRGKKIYFVPFVNETELRNLYNGAEAVIFPQVEDFGLVAAEAQACGTPVIAYGKGGVRDTVSKDAGVFFAEQTEESLAGALQDFAKRTFDHAAIRKHAEKFSSRRFRQQIKEIVAASAVHFRPAATRSSMAA